MFYIGCRYVGPMFCQDIQHLYLKRKGIIHGTRWWGMITYGKYDDCDSVENILLNLRNARKRQFPIYSKCLKWQTEVSFEDLSKYGMAWSS